MYDQDTSLTLEPEITTGKISFDRSIRYDVNNNICMGNAAATHATMSIAQDISALFCKMTVQTKQCHLLTT
jgi:hypothetical protein